MNDLSVGELLIESNRSIRSLTWDIGAINARGVIAAWPSLAQASRRVLDCETIDTADWTAADVRRPGVAGSLIWPDLLGTTALPLSSISLAGRQKDKLSPGERTHDARRAVTGSSRLAYSGLRMTLVQPLVRSSKFL